MCRHTVEARPFYGPVRKWVLEGIPDTCPLCHRAVQPELIASTSIRIGEYNTVQVVYRCRSKECQEVFIATYEREGSLDLYELKKLAPTNVREVSLPEEVTKTSPDFVRIYNQAIVAESADLEQLVGMGFRKALEFLIKDFASQEHPDRQDEIRRMSLGECIKTYIDVDVQEFAERAAWLGNDETHYVRKWENKDIQDLKKLVELTMIEIRKCLARKKYSTEMPNRKT